jgi:hypothetical protein
VLCQHSGEAPELGVRGEFAVNDQERRLNGLLAANLFNRFLEERAMATSLMVLNASSFMI